MNANLRAEAVVAATASETAGRSGHLALLGETSARPAREMPALLQAFAILCAVAAINSLRPVLPEAVLSLLLIAALPALYLGARRYVGVRIWGAYVVAVALFVTLRTFADSTGVPVGFRYPIEVSKAVFGTAESVWLQQRLYDFGRVGPLEAYCVFIYLTYFFGHYVAGFALWRTDRQQFRVFATAVIATLFIGLAFYFIVPTAPPWLAAEQGYLDGIVRIPKVFSEELVSGAYASGAAVAGDNDVAAMPSLHIAVTAVIAMAAARRGWALALLGLAYVLSMGFSLVYLGEHYVIDLVAGVVLGIGVYRVVEKRLASREIGLLGGRN